MLVGGAAALGYFVWAILAFPSGAHIGTHNEGRAATFVVSIPAAQLTKYKQYAQALQTANDTATKGFASAGSTPTPAQIAAVVTRYWTALNLYDFQLHFIQWPASMQAAIAVDHARLKSLMSFLKSISFVGPTGMNLWLSDLHNLTNTTQTADNQIHQDLGLPSSSSFP